MRVKASRALVSNFVDQIMYHGFFHGDPHPGNVAITPDNQLVLYDFGLCVNIDLELRNGLISLAPSIIQKDTSAVVDGLVSWGSFSRQQTPRRLSYSWTQLWTISRR